MDHLFQTKINDPLTRAGELAVMAYYSDMHVGWDLLDVSKIERFQKGHCDFVLREKSSVPWEFHDVKSVNHLDDKTNWICYEVVEHWFEGNVDPKTGWGVHNATQQIDYLFKDGTLYRFSKASVFQFLKESKWGHAQFEYHPEKGYMTINIMLRKEEFMPYCKVVDIEHYLNQYL